MPNMQVMQMPAVRDGPCVPGVTAGPSSASRPPHQIRRRDMRSARVASHLLTGSAVVGTPGTHGCLHALHGLHG